MTENRHAIPASPGLSPETDSRPARFPRLLPAPSVGAMTHDIDITALVEEIERYLAAVDAFRVAGCEPTWRADSPALAGKEARCSSPEHH